MISEVYELLERVRKEHVPDARTAVFEVDVAREDGSLVVYGACSEAAAVEALHRGIADLDLELPIRDEVQRLPQAVEDGRTHAVIRAATAPMLAGPLISESHLSQALLGHRVTVLREHGRWLHCRSVDGYLGWIHRGYLWRMSEVDARAWELGGDGAVHVSLGAEVVDDSGDVMVRAPWGSRLVIERGTVRLPDGRAGEARGALIRATDVRERFPTDGGAIVRTAEGWRGSPYLWGGTTPWGVDCSGLAQAVYRMHGIELPRDSDQQAQIGDEISTADQFERLRPGDLLFFAERPDRISHVAISMGGSRIIHSAVGNGGVRSNDLLGETAYERELRELLVTVRRVISAAR